MREFAVSVSSLFVGDGWQLMLGVLFMLDVVFLPGGVMEGFRRLISLFRKRGPGDGAAASKARAVPVAAE